MKINKNITKIIILTFISILCFSVTAFGDSEQITVYVNNEKVDFEVNPVLENGRILVPLRGVFENLGAQVDWNKNIMEVIIKDKNNEIAMMLDKNKVMVNGEIKDIDTTVKMVNSRTFAPIRFISETLGHDVKWDGTSNSVYITKNESPSVIKNNIPTIGSEENLIALLEYNSKLFSYIGLRGIEGRDIRVVDKAMEVATDSASGEAAPTQNDSSNTNNQVDGVDEGDIIKNDGTYIYVKTNDGIKVIDSNPKSPNVISEVIVPENMYISEIFITENKLVVIGQNNYYNTNNKLDDSLRIGIVAPRYYENRCNVLIYNIEVKEKPILEREYLFDGDYSSGRTIDNNLYLVTSKYLNVGYDQYNKENFSIPLPSYTDCITNEKIEIGYDQIRYFPNYVDSKYVMTVGINLQDKTAKPDVDAYLGSTESIFVSSDSLYTTVTDFSYDTNAKSIELYNPVYIVNTVIYKFKLEDGKISPDSQGEVPGTIINQFSMDEYKDMLRIATTTGEVWQTGQNESKNNVYILNDNLSIVGKLEGLAPGERIYSTRFMGDKVYMVTFKQVDPLYVIDTSELTKPKVLGFLKIPGYSTYLHPIDETHILGFGYDTEENSSGGTITSGLKISLFDVGDVSKPKEISKVVIGKSGTYSELLYNHKALMFSQSKGIMAFPITRMGDNYSTEFVGAYIYNVSANEIKLKTEISHMENIKDGYINGNEIKRIIYIGDYVYTFSDNLMQVHSIENNKKISELTIN